MAAFGVRIFGGTSGEEFTSVPTTRCYTPAVPCTKDGPLLYRVSKLDWDVCAFKARCCPKQLARKIPRDVHEEARDVARQLMGTKAFLRSRDERKRVEMPFARLKIHHGFERMRLRGLSGARDELHLAAIVQNLKTLALRALGPPRIQPRAPSD
jgi:hypothetical protein